MASDTNYVLLVIAKTEELDNDMKFIGRMANVSFATNLGDDVFVLQDFRYFSNFGFQ